MNKFGIPDSVINSVNAVLEAGTKMPRQLKDPKKETMMGFEYKPGKVRNQVVDKKDVKDKEKKGYIHTEEAEEDDIAEAMEMHLKPHGTAGTHYTVHKVGKKLAAHGGIKVGDKLSDTHVDDAMDSGVKVKHVKEDTEQVDEFVAGMVGKTLAGMAIKPLVKLGAKAAVGGVAMAAGKHAYDKVTGRDKKKIEVTTKSESHDVDEAAPMPTEKQKATTDRIKTRMAKTKKVVEGAMKRGSALKTFRKRPLDPVDHKDLKGSHADRKDKDIDNDGKVDDTDTYLHHRRKTVKKAMKEDVGEEKVRSSAQAAQLAKHYYAKAKAAQASGSKEEAAKMMSAAKTFYRKSESDQAQEKGGKQVAKAESTENVGIGEYYFNELEIEEIEAAEDIVTEEKRKNSGAKVGETERSGHRVTKTEKEGPEHIVMQARKVVSLGHQHSGVEFKDGSKAKVHPNDAHKALNRYNSAKPAEKEHMQNTMNHSHAGFKHVASGKAMDHKDNPHKPKANKLSGSDRRTDRAVGLMRHPDDED